MKIHLGCNDDLKPGWLNVDCITPPGVEMLSDFSHTGMAVNGAHFKLADLAKRWPLDNDSADYILANDVFEHLAPTLKLSFGEQFEVTAGPGGERLDNAELLTRRTDIPPKVWCLNESWRVLRPGGILEFTVPCVHLEDRNHINPAAFSDPSHVSYWTYEDAFYFGEQFNHPGGERGRLGPGMGITARFKFPTMLELAGGLWVEKPNALGTLDLKWTVKDYGPKMSRRSKLHARLEAVK